MSRLSGGGAGVLGVGDNININNNSIAGVIEGVGAIRYRVAGTIVLIKLHRPLPRADYRLFA